LALPYNLPDLPEKFSSCSFAFIWRKSNFFKFGLKNNWFGNIFSEFGEYRYNLISYGLK